MIERIEFTVIKPGQNVDCERWFEVGKAWILIHDLKLAIIESYRKYHRITWLYDSPVSATGHQLTVEQDPMKFIRMAEEEEQTDIVSVRSVEGRGGDSK